MINKSLIIEILRFGLVGAIGFFINFAVLSFLNGHYHVGHVLGEVFAMLVALQITFVLHDNWTYVGRDNGYSLRQIRRYLTYLLSNTAGSVITVFCYAMLSNKLTTFFALAIAAAIGMIWNFCINRFVIWKHRKLQSPRASLVIKPQVE